MWWRLKRSEFSEMRGEPNRQALKTIVDSGEIPGLLAYTGDQPVGWCSVGPRDVFPALDRSPILKRVDDSPVWSVVCFFIAKPYRRQGLMVALIQAAVDFARQNGAKLLEAYPEDPGDDHAYDSSAFTGLAAAFRKVGFVEVLRRSVKRPVMRYIIE